MTGKNGYMIAQKYLRVLRRCAFSQIKQSKVYKYVVSQISIWCWIYTYIYSYPLKIWLATCIFYIAHSLNDIVKFLLSQGMKYVLTEHFNQDPIEVFFGQQRSRGGCCDNLSAKQFLRNTQAIMVQKSLALGGTSNISRKRSNPFVISPLSRPVAKCRRTRIVKWWNTVATYMYITGNSILSVCISFT